jgi:hypothetical protein
MIRNLLNKQLLIEDISLTTRPVARNCVDKTQRFHDTTDHPEFERSSEIFKVTCEIFFFKCQMHILFFLYLTEPF